VFPIVIPPLRKRTEDIPALVDHFIQKKSLEVGLHKLPALSTGAMERLQDYHWPGNVRELEILVERELIKIRGKLSDGVLRFDQLQPVAYQTKDESEKGGKGLIKLEDAIAYQIRNALEAKKGRIKGENGAAALLGINPSTLRSKMKKLGITAKPKS
jgi:transcriptional regulator with GAF, ATPase, and Fis domain